MPDAPEELAKLIRSQLTVWMDELDELRRDPKVRHYLSLQRKVNQRDAFRVEAAAPPAKHDRFGIPSNELSALKSEDLEDVIVHHSPVPKRG